MIKLEPKVKSKGLKRTPFKRKPPKTRIKSPQKIGSIPLNKIKKAVAKNPPKLRKTPLKPMSKKMIIQRKAENELSLKMAELSGNRCEICGQNDFRGLHKHEIIRRGQQGNELDPMNCLMLCLTCHDHRKYPKSGTPLSIEEQQALAEKLHENIL
jgi:hypothetical protein